MRNVIAIMLTIVSMNVCAYTMCDMDGSNCHDSNAMGDMDGKNYKMPNEICDMDGTHCRTM